MGYRWFFDRTFASHVDLTQIPEAEKQQYIAEWSQPGGFTAMLNWYRGSKVIVPPPGVTVPLPDFAAPRLPEGEGADAGDLGNAGHGAAPASARRSRRVSCDDLTIVRLPDAGHFAPWEAGDEVADALRPFLAARAKASAPAA